MINFLNEVSCQQIQQQYIKNQQMISPAPTLPVRFIKTNRITHSDNQNNFGNIKTNQIGKKRQKSKHSLENKKPIIQNQNKNCQITFRGNHFVQSIQPRTSNNCSSNQTLQINHVQSLASLYQYLQCNDNISKTYCQTQQALEDDMFWIKSICLANCKLKTNQIYYEQCVKIDQIVQKIIMKSSKPKFQLPCQKPMGLMKISSLTNTERRQNIDSNTSSLKQTRVENQNDKSQKSNALSQKSNNLYQNSTPYIELKKMMYMLEEQKKSQRNNPGTNSKSQLKDINKQQGKQNVDQSSFQSHSQYSDGRILYEISKESSLMCQSISMKKSIDKNRRSHTQLVQFVQNGQNHEKDNDKKTILNGIISMLNNKYKKKINFNKKL